MQSEAPRPNIRSPWMVALKGGNCHLVSSSTGTTSVWDMNIRPALPERPSTRAMRLPRLGADSSISEETPSWARKSRASSQTGVSSPVGMAPVFTEGIRTNDCSRAIISSRDASTWAKRSCRSGITLLPSAIAIGFGECNQGNLQCQRQVATISTLANPSCQSGLIIARIIP